jgi:hypothetical protein
MYANIPLYDLGVIATILTVNTTFIIFQLKRYYNSEKPIRRRPPYFILDSHRSHTEEEYAEQDESYRKQYNKELVEYYLTYLFPVIICIFAYIIIFNILVGISFCIAGIISVVLSVLITKR